MKKIAIPLALFSAISFSNIVSAQSNVTVYGKIDLGVGRNIGTDYNGILQGAASRLGFKGQEDLGGGWKSSFHLQHRFNADTGTATNPQKFWHADSWVGLEGPYGQVRLGRMFTPSYEYVMLPSDPFQHSRVSSTLVTHVGGGKDGVAAASPIRFDNGVNYNVKSGGLRFGATFAPSEGVASVRNAYSAAVSYTTGKLYVAVGRENPSGANNEWNTISARWGDDTLKVFTFFGKGKSNASVNNSIQSYSVGATGKLGYGTLKTAYARMDNKDLNTKIQDKFAVGYYYNLSKRTQVYADIAHDRAYDANKNGFNLGIVHDF